MPKVPRKGIHPLLILTLNFSSEDIFDIISYLEYYLGCESPFTDNHHEVDCSSCISRFVAGQCRGPNSSGEHLHKLSSQNSACYLASRFHWNNLSCLILIQRIDKQNSIRPRRWKQEPSRLLER
jgi:hypothetical protein